MQTLFTHLTKVQTVQNPRELTVGVKGESPRALLFAMKGVVPGACMEEVCLCNNNKGKWEHREKAT